MFYRFSWSLLSMHYQIWYVVACKNASLHDALKFYPGRLVLKKTSPKMLMPNLAFEHMPKLKF